MPTAILLVLLGITATAADKPNETIPKYRLQWRDLERLVKNSRVSLELPSGVRLQGDVAGVEPDALVLYVTKSSDKHAYVKGRASVPREEISRLHVYKRTGATWRIAGTAIGGGLGALVGIPIALATGNEGNPRVDLAALAIGIPAALGYAAGHATDHRTFVIDVEKPEE